ncbi:unnamed protein product [Anisakis simplex]|uniref:Uncharacterized protein n=1 Tax=Anisakis simplex TaxID=6269 RepID=A0A0M3JPY5_ANISI|nr:unnamed protein product [Anisakis simplex]
MRSAEEGGGVVGGGGVDGKKQASEAVNGAEAGTEKTMARIRKRPMKQPVIPSGFFEF